VAEGALITGASGFAGGHLLERLVSAGVPVQAWAHRGATQAGSSAVTWSTVDMLDREAVREGVRRANPSVVYHLAGAADVHSAWHDPARPLRVNAFGTHNLLESVREAAPSSRILVTGSAMVYKPQAGIITEDSPLGPTGPYGLSKLAQEMIAAQSALATILIRPFNHAGPRQSASYSTSAFAQQIAQIEAGRAEPVLRVGNLDAQRDVTDVRDTVRAYEALADRGRPGIPYNVCCGRAYSIRALLDILLSLARIRVRVETDPARLRPSDNPVIVGSHARLTADTGWTPQIPIEQTLSDLLEYWRRADA
jgi:GDP-4-dehydro-6-deoxy-D-mannose reductase